MSCGAYHTVAIEESGYLFIWGKSKANCSKQNILIPTKIVELKNRCFK